MLDMHLHSQWSDGSLNINDLVNKLSHNGITHAVLTDHDCILGAEEFANLCKAKKIKTINGVELEAYYDVKNSLYLHMLCYGFKDHKLLNDFLEYERNLRIKSIYKGLEKINKKGFNFKFEDVQKMSEGRHLLINHLCILLEKEKIVKSKFDAYNMFLDPKSEYYVDYPKFSVKQIMDIINKVGGIPVLAHPKRIRMNSDEKDKYISVLKDWGLEGIEAYYSFDNDNERKFSIEMSKKYNLIETVGSDWHCDEEHIPFGNMFITDEKVKILKRKFFNE